MKEISYKAFTLVEMLIVMGILVILIVIGASTGRYAIDRSNEIEHKNGATQLYQAAQSFYTDNGVFPENQQAQIRLQLSNILQVIIAQRLIPLDQGGRRAVSEILFNTPAVANLIRESKTHQIDNVIRTSADIGMVYLEKSLVSLVREGVITAQKAQEYAVYPDEVVRLLQG